MIVNNRPQTTLSTKDFYYDLPESQIAQTPAEPRDSSRLLVVDAKTGETQDRIFRDIVDYLHPGDTLVVNDSKVIPARLYGVKADSGIECEVVLLRMREADVWECLVRPGRRLKPGAIIVFGNGLCRATVNETVEGGNRLLSFVYDKEKWNFYTLLDEIGQMPLPPYITEKLRDKDRYQTIYANEEGSAAAPTAGLHFTNELLDKIRQMDVAVVPVMLHVGLGTFRPVKVESITDHEMHSEYFVVSEAAARTINERRRAGGRTICVGTTSCRTLESAADENGMVHAMQGDTGIFIYPGYRFKAMDALITNFHLPESTLLMLVSAFSSREIMLNTYNEAVEKGYRFFSFGDAMFIS
ncbi:MAG: tRNA preQ1(34) S-adenosylmethionine ribosyltransferase-isomerase QueA [Ruminococcaceae bacterium]|nr:tRNA preQ1(34) S-adenosylmethionine ribosyltransferase-isomerase QueA [Oscillospiraceae bacterium]